MLHAVLCECLHEVTGLKADARGGRLHDGIDGARVVALGWAFARLGRGWRVSCRSIPTSAPACGFGYRV